MRTSGLSAPSELLVMQAAKIDLQRAAKHLTWYKKRVWSAVERIYCGYAIFPLAPEMMYIRLVSFAVGMYWPTRNTFPKFHK